MGSEPPAEKNPRLTKYGEHWYRETDMIVNPVDRFADSFNATIDELVWIG